MNAPVRPPELDPTTESLFTLSEVAFVEWWAKHSDMAHGTPREIAKLAFQSGFAFGGAHGTELAMANIDFLLTRKRP